ncbi:MAG TPA: group I intron-associated PD-(D/E)XK endonuclease [Ktedonobacteraceae bacterium]|nr:group I intron-associated PD-(D/E)XK endonuclease [Ktedonobacteraceae bacterium]
MGILGPKRHTQKTGDISESAVVTRLLQCGYDVLLPYGQMHRYDLAIEHADGQFWRVQVKTGWLNEDQSVIQFASSSSMNYTVKHRGSRSYRGQCEYFAVYVEALNKVYFIPVDEVSLARSTLRLTPSKNNQEKHVRWAKDYEL